MHTNTVDIEIFTQYVFSRIERSSLDALKYDVSEYINHYWFKRINY